MILPVTLANIKLLLGITDTSQDTGITALIALQQPAFEYALDGVILANTSSDAGLQATLTLGVVEALAGNYLASMGRPLITQQTFRISTLEVSTRPFNDQVKMGAALLAQGIARLSPFSRSARALARTASGSDANMDDQAPVPLLIGTGMGQAGSIPTTGAASGPPPDSDFDAVLGTDGQTDPPSGDIVSPGAFFGFFDGGGE